MKTIIETKNLTKKFGKFLAVDDVSLSVNKGEIYGFLGLNGAGKTTTIRMLLGMVSPTKGETRIIGEKIRRGGHGPWEKIGCLVEVPYAYPDLTVQENLEIFRQLRGLADISSVGTIMEQLKLKQYASTKAAHLSLGNAQRLGLAKALLHKPDILILDEPSNGLDPAGIVEIRKLLLELAHNQGVTIFISSHILAEIAKIAERIGIIHRGKLLEEINVSQLDKRLRKCLRIKTRNNDLALKVLSHKGLKPVISENNEIELLEQEVLLNPENIATSLVNEAVPPVSLFTYEEDLESYFLRIIQQDPQNE